MQPFISLEITQYYC